MTDVLNFSLSHAESWGSPHDYAFNYVLCLLCHVGLMNSATTFANIFFDDFIFISSNI